MVADNLDAGVKESLLVSEARLVGITPDQLRGSAWERLSRGLYAVAPADATLQQRANAWAKVLPRQSGFGHLTSAVLRGWWTPNVPSTSLLFATTRSKVHVQRPGLYVRRSSFADLDPETAFPLVSTPHTLVELARDLSLLDLVPAVDCALRDGADRASILDAARPRVPGARRLQQAVALADARSESWWETILRLLHVLSGLGPVEPQVEIRTAGHLLARADLHLVGTCRYPEYDGEDHRDRARHQEDLARDKALSRLGLQRYGYTAREIIASPDRIIRDAEQARGWRHSAHRLRAWWQWAAPSTLTSSGQQRLLARLARYAHATHRPD